MSIKENGTAWYSSSSQRNNNIFIAYYSQVVAVKVMNADLAQNTSDEANMKVREPL